ncbi:MAG: ribosome silencing factor [Candidatus Margulisiibacteriota bacterium]
MAKKTEKYLEIIIKAIEEKKGVDLQVFDLRNREETSFDYAIICTGNSNVQIRAIKDSLRETLTAKKLKRFSDTGRFESNWLILDYGAYIIHILGPEERRFYHLEDLWKDAGVIYH